MKLISAWEEWLAVCHDGWKSTVCTTGENANKTDVDAAAKCFQGQVATSGMPAACFNVVGPGQCRVE